MSIIEIILASGLFVIVATSIITLILQSYGSNRLSNELTVANQYAAEGMEAARSVRDQSYALLAVSSGTGVAISSGKWAFGGTSTVFDKFTRTVSISAVNRDISGNVTSIGTLDPNTKKVVSTVTWNTSPTRADSVVQTTYLTNWRAPIPIPSPYRAQITIDHTKVASSTGTENYANFPILVSVTTSSLAYTSSGGHVGNADGSDIYFTASDGATKLNHEIESYSSSTGALVAWVNVGASGLSTSTDSVFYMYYGDAGAANQQNVAATWDANYKGVWHFPNGTILTSLDSTSNGNSASCISGIGNTQCSATAGQVKGGVFLNINQNAYESVANAANLNITGAITIEEWVFVSANAYQTFAQKSSFGTLGVNNSRIITWNRGAQITGATAIPLSTFTHVAAVSNAGSGTQTEIIYKNGSVDGSGTQSNTVTDTADTAKFGVNGSGYNNLAGRLDEIRISNIARTPDWIQTEYNNQSNPSMFLTVGAEQTL